jgi:hypothetical protein
VAESVVVLLVMAVSFVVDATATAADAVESAAGTLVVSGADTKL